MPITTVAAVAAVAVSAVGVGASVMGASAQADAQSKNLAYQAAVARNNTILAQRASADALARGQVAQQNQAAAGRQLLGKERATLASNGVDVNSGSALDITTDTAGENKLDQLTVLSNAQREADGFTAQGGNFNAQAALDTAAADNQGSGVLGTAFAGAGSVAAKWYDFSKLGSNDTGADTSLSNVQFSTSAAGDNDG